MPTTQPWFYDQVVRELSRLYAEKRSGTLYLSTQDNRAVRIVLESGTMVFISFGQFRGIDALPPLKTLKSATARFEPSDGHRGVKEHDLPSTREILETLGAGATVTESTHFEPPSTVPDLERILKTEATVFLGPIAALVCEDKLAQAGAVQGMHEVNAIITGIASVMTDDEKREEFRQQVLERIQGKV